MNVSSENSAMDSKLKELLSIFGQNFTGKL